MNDHERQCLECDAIVPVDEMATEDLCGICYTDPAEAYARRYRHQSGPSPTYQEQLAEARAHDRRGLW